MDVIAYVIRSNNYIPADKGLSLNVCTIKNIQGLNRVSINSEWEDLTRKSCIISVEIDDNWYLLRAVGIALARCKHMENPSNILLKRHYDSIRKKDRKRMNKYNTIVMDFNICIRRGAEYIYRDARNCPRGAKTSIGALTAWYCICSGVNLFELST